MTAVVREHSRRVLRRGRLGSRGWKDACGERSLLLLEKLGSVVTLRLKCTLRMVYDAPRELYVIRWSPRHISFFPFLFLSFSFLHTSQLDMNVACSPDCEGPRFAFIAQCIPARDEKYPLVVRYRCLTDYFYYRLQRTPVCIWFSSNVESKKN